MHCYVPVAAFVGMIMLKKPILINVYLGVSQQYPFMCVLCSPFIPCFSSDSLNVPCFSHVRMFLLCFYFFYAPHLFPGPLTRTCSASSPSSLLADLWCLVNNAGVMILAQCEWQTQDMVAGQVEVNLLGLIQVTKALLPILRRNKGESAKIYHTRKLLCIPSTSYEDESQP